MRLNEEIRVKEVRLISPDGEQIGIKKTEEALSIAESYDLDLVEVAPNASPPVCRIMDYGKYRYQQSKKEKISKKKQHVIHIKEIRLRPTIDQHDIEFKMKQARKFIEQGNHLKIRILFRGRQIVHRELGQAVLKRVEDELEDIAKMESDPIQEHRSITTVFIPK
ncbi:translation initiation factor IF-3 [bacterium]|nr:translation initiation factor IF-3 [bacterium]